MKNRQQKCKILGWCCHDNATKLSRCEGCRSCDSNDDEKRETQWEFFLRKRCGRYVNIGPLPQFIHNCRRKCGRPILWTKGGDSVWISMCRTSTIGSTFQKRLGLHGRLFILWTDYVDRTIWRRYNISVVHVRVRNTVSLTRPHSYQKLALHKSFTYLLIIDTNLEHFDGILELHVQPQNRFPSLPPKAYIFLHLKLKMIYISWRRISTLKLHKFDF